MDMAITGLLMNMFPFIKRLLFYLSSFTDHSCSVGDNFITRFQAVCNNVFFSIITGATLIRVDTAFPSTTL